MKKILDWLCNKVIHANPYILWLLGIVAGMFSVGIFALLELSIRFFIGGA